MRFEFGFTLFMCWFCLTTIKALTMSAKYFLAISGIIMLIGIFKEAMLKNKGVKT